MAGRQAVAAAIDDIDMPDMPAGDEQTGDARSSNGSAPNRTDPANEFEIVETDSDLRPLTDGREEAPLSEEDGQTLLDQRRAETQPSRKQSQALRRKEGKHKTQLDNALLLAELAELRTRVGDLEPRITNIDEGRRQEYAAALDRAIEAEKGNVAKARRDLSEAMAAAAQGEEGAAGRVDQALADRDSAFMRGQDLFNRKNQLARQPASEDRQGAETGNEPQPVRRAQQQQPQKADPVIEVRVRDFQEEHPWFNAASEDPNEVADTRVLLRIDREVAAAGYDPRTRAYWTEIESRAGAELPHRFEDGEQLPPLTRGGARASASQRQPAEQRRGPMTSGASDRAPVSTDKRVYLSPERKQALVQAGALDSDMKTIANKDKYARILRGYQTYDRDNSVARQ